MGYVPMGIPNTLYKCEFCGKTDSLRNPAQYEDFRNVDRKYRFLKLEELNNPIEVCTTCLSVYEVAPEGFSSTIKRIKFKKNALHFFPLILIGALFTGYIVAVVVLCYAGGRSF